MNVEYETIKHLEIKIGESLWEVGFGKEFLNATPRAPSIQEKKWINRTSLKLKIFVLQKALLRKWKDKL